MLDPFDTPVLPGIAARPDLLSAAEERALAEEGLARDLAEWPEY